MLVHNYHNMNADRKLVMKVVSGCVITKQNWKMTTGKWTVHGLLLNSFGKESAMVNNAESVKSMCGSGVVQCSIVVVGESFLISTWRLALKKIGCWNGERIVDVGTAYITFGTSIVRVSCVGALPGGDVLQQYLRTLWWRCRCVETVS